MFSTFNDTAGLTGATAAPSIDGSSTVVFGFENGAAVVAPQRPVRGQGGFVNLGFPLSRIFGADPKGRNAGWSTYLHYGYDQATARDARRFGGRAKSDVFMGSLQYRLNAFVTFALEESLFRTRAANNSRLYVGGLPLFRGVPSREARHPLRVRDNLYVLTGALRRGRLLTTVASSGRSWRTPCAELSARNPPPP